MTERTGLRERKKERTRQAISEAAISLFLERGFDRVSVTEIAAAAEVSKPTLFRYFPTKEDLVLRRIADHQGEWARVVRERAAGEPPLTALRRHFLDRLRAYDPVTGLNDHPGVLAFHGLLYSTPTLLARLVSYSGRDRDALTEVLRETAGTDEGSGPGDLTPRLAATQLVGVHQVLAQANWRKVAEAGRAASEVLPEALAEADRAFALLGTGLAGRYG